ncbi:MAG: PilZ domain-containing protein [Treponemataceae bacterium]
MIELRRNIRYVSFARARIAGLHEGEALLRDLSVTGFRLEFTAAVAFDSKTPCSITILPEDRAAVESFSLVATPEWSRAEYDTFEVGFSITASPKGKTFQRYVDYLSWISTAKTNA